jgi:hypothetical protein
MLNINHKRRRLLNRLPYARDRGVLSKIMTKNMMLHAAWQLLILGTLIFVVGSSSCTSPPVSSKSIHGCKHPSAAVGPSSSSSSSCP